MMAVNANLIRVQAATTAGEKEIAVAAQERFHLRAGSRLLSLILALMVLFCGSTLLAQGSGQGTLNGAVTDASGAQVPLAKITLTNKDTGVVIQSVADKAGLYNVTPLLPGTYSIGVVKQGFQESLITGVLISAAQTTTSNVKLAVGSDQVSVTVTAQGNDLAKTTSDVETTVEHHLVEDIPYPEQSALEAVLLVPGVTGDPLSVGGIASENPGYTTGATSPGGSLRVGGSIPGTSAIYVDGTDVTQASYPRAGINLSGLLVQQTTVITSGLSAKYGRTGGGVIIQASAPGTSQYHGGLTYRHTDPFFNAYPDGNAAPSGLHQNFFGGYLGGPVYIPKLYNGKGKTFFFVGVEPARFRNVVGVNAYLLTPAELAGHFAGTPSLNGGLHLYYQSMLNAQGFPNGPKYNSTGLYQQVPNDDLSAQLAQNPFAQFVASLQPTPANPGPYVRFLSPDGSITTGTYNAIVSRGVTNIDNRYSVRIDHQISNTDRVFARFTSIPVSAPRFYGVPASNPLDNVPTDKALSQDFVFDYTHVFGNSIVNEAHVSYLRDKDTRTPPDSALTEDFGAQYGLPAAGAGVGFPSLGNLNPSGYTGISQGSSTAADMIDEDYQFGDDLTWTHGKHLFQMGMDLRRIQSNQTYKNSYYGGTYGFSAGQTNNGSNGGDPFASFILGLTNAFSNEPLLIESYYRWHSYAGYFQDDWRVLSTVTLNLGLRYEFETPRMEKDDNQAFFIPSVTGTSTNGTPATGGFCFADNFCNGYSRTLWPDNFRGFEPRIGIAWSATKNTTVRGAYAILRAPLTGYEATPNPNFSTAASAGGTVTANPIDYITNPVQPTSSTFPAAKAAGEGFDNTLVSGFSIPYVDQSNKVPYVQQYALTFQYQPFGRTLIQAGYSGIHGIHLIEPNTGSNTPDRNAISYNSAVNAVKNHVNLAAQLVSCASNNVPGCGNPYGVTTTNAVTHVTTVVAENALQALTPYQNFFAAKLYEDYPRFGAVSYNAVNLSVRQSYGNGLSLLSYYTWSKSIDNYPSVGNGSSGGSGSTNFQDSANATGEKGVANYDQPSTFKAGYTYQLPIGPGKSLNINNRFLYMLAGGFSTSGIATVASGFPNYITLGTAGYFQSQPLPANPTSGTLGAPTSALPDGDVLRPNIVPGVPLINPNWRRDPFGLNGGGYLNPRAFTTPGSVGNPQFGNAPRTLTDARSPRELLFDMGVRKNFVSKSTPIFSMPSTIRCFSV
jgi:hypothetical protein